MLRGENTEPPNGPKQKRQNRLATAYIKDIQGNTISFSVPTWVEYAFRVLIVISTLIWPLLLILAIYNKLEINEIKKDQIQIEEEHKSNGNTQNIK